MRGVGVVRKQGAKRKAGVSGYLLLPQQVAQYVTPLHVALELLPLGLFNKDHANSLAQVINLMSVDSAARNKIVYSAANACADILSSMFERVQHGKSWNVTAEERAQLRGYILIFDRALRTWTSQRLLTNAVTVDLHNSLAKDRGGKLLDRLPLTESEMAEVEAWVRASTAGLTSRLRKPSAARFRNLEPGAKYR